MKAQRPSASIWISVSSLFVACLSLWFSIDAQRSDREYKEISIRPSLILDAAEENYSVKVKNNGLGPAVIKRIGYKFTGDCVEFDEANADGWVTPTRQPFGTYFLEGLIKAMREFGFEYPEPFKYQVHLPSPGLLISTGSEYAIFTLEPSEGEKLRNRLRDRGLVTQIQEKFFSLAREIPLFMDYCSATGKFCVNSRHQKVCSHNPLHI
jgi:hypothetical protein